MALTYDDLLAPFFEAMKPRDAWRIGAEAEKFGVDAQTGAPIDYDGPRGVRLVLERLAERYGWARSTEKPGGPLIALEQNGASITLEPGAQLELSGAPLPDIHAICAEMHTHLDEVRDVTSDLGVAWLGVGFHPFARQEDLPWVPKSRYAIMREYLPTKGANGLDMMRRTCTVQANFDYADEADAMRKMRVALRLSPVVTAIFANSPFAEGRPSGDRSRRARVWLSVDPSRQGLVPALWREGAKIRDYVEWALDAPMFLVKRDDEIVHNTGQTFRSFWHDGFDGHRARREDWVTHLNTLFPEVRLKRTIEVRGADSLPHKTACALPALWTGLLYDDAALAAADELTADFRVDEVEAIRADVAASALAASFRGRPIAELAANVLDLAKGGLARRARMSAGGRDEGVHLDRIAALVERGLSPADALLEGLPSEPEAMRREILLRAEV